MPLEIPALWSPEAVRAQAVAARTYAAYERAHPRAGHYQLCDTSSCQVYGGYDAEHPASNAAVDATRQPGPDSRRRARVHAVLVEQRRLDLGRLRALPRPPRRDPYDGWSGNPVHAWSHEGHRRAPREPWPAIGNLTAIDVTRRDGNGEWGGRVRHAHADGAGARAGLRRHLPRRLGLRSTWLTVPGRPAR